MKTKNQESPHMKTARPIASRKGAEAPSVSSQSAMRVQKALARLSEADRRLARQVAALFNGRVVKVTGRVSAATLLALS
jgi:hypothetical protein